MAQNPFFSSSRIPPAVLGMAASVLVAAPVVLVFEATLGK